MALAHRREGLGSSAAVAGTGAWSPASRIRQEPFGDGLARETWGRIPTAPGVPVFLRLTTRPTRP